MEISNKMMGKYIIPVPYRFKTKLERNCVLSNYKRLLPVSIILFIVSISINEFKSNFISILLLKKIFIVLSLIFIPIIYIIWRKRESVSVKLAQFVQAIYYFIMLIITATVVLGVQELSFLHFYLMAVFGMAVSVEIHPINMFFLILPSHLFIVYMAPYFNNDYLIVRTLITNIYVCNIAAVILSVISYNNRISSFINRELVIEKNDLLADLVRRDGMTGLYNHEASFRKLKEEIDYSNRMGCPLSVIILDIDDFKKVNDSYGHLTGDSVLKKLSKLMIDVTRITDTVGRYGGEEFIIILPGTDIEGAKIVAQKIKSELDSTSFEKNISITVSGGVSQYSNQSVEELINITDQKLYIAKKAGKNRFIYSNENRR